MFSAYGMSEETLKFNFKVILGTKIVPVFVLIIYWAMCIHAKVRNEQLLNYLFNLVKAFCTVNLTYLLTSGFTVGGCIRDFQDFWIKICCFYMCFMYCSLKVSQLAHIYFHLQNNVM